jgi:RimJ/RimL family protein N-acetyltransferase
MQPTESTAFAGFAPELGRVAARDALELAQREHFCRAGVSTLYVAVSDAGEPIYAQWLIRMSEQDALHHATKGLFPPLGEGEALVEAAYTFVAYRRLGAMADGMYQLLLRAREAGDRCVFTYVDADNVPSLRGCAKAGFVPDHVRENSWRFGRRSVHWRPLDGVAEAIWADAVA